MLYLGEVLINSGLEGSLYCLIQTSLETIAFAAPGSLYFRIRDTFVFTAAEEHSVNF